MNIYYTVGNEFHYERVWMDRGNLFIVCGKCNMLLATRLYILLNIFLFFAGFSLHIFNVETWIDVVAREQICTPAKGAVGLIADVNVNIYKYFTVLLEMGFNLRSFGFFMRRLVIYCA